MDILGCLNSFHSYLHNPSIRNVTHGENNVRSEFGKDLNIRLPLPINFTIVLIPSTFIEYTETLLSVLFLYVCQTLLYYVSTPDFILYIDPFYCR